MTYLVISSLIFSVITILVPKRLSKIEIYASVFSALYFQLLVDVYLHIKLRWYYYLREDVIEWSTMFVIPIFVGVNVLFLNYFPFNSTRKKQALYITFCVMLSIVYEFLANQFTMLHYNEWKLWYSALCYFFLFPLLVINLKWIKRLVVNTK